MHVNRCEFLPSRDKFSIFGINMAQFHKRNDVIFVKFD